MAGDLAGLDFGAGWRGVIVASGAGDGGLAGVVPVGIGAAAGSSLNAAAGPGETCGSMPCAGGSPGVRVKSGDVGDGLSPAPLPLTGGAFEWGCEGTAAAIAITGVGCATTVGALAMQGVSGAASVQRGFTAVRGPATTGVPVAAGGEMRGEVGAGRTMGIAGMLKGTAGAVGLAATGTAGMAAADGAVTRLWFASTDCSMAGQEVAAVPRGAARARAPGGVVSIVRPAATSCMRKQPFIEAGSLIANIAPDVRREDFSRFCPATERHPAESAVSPAECAGSDVPTQTLLMGAKRGQPVVSRLVRGWHESCEPNENRDHARLLGVVAQPFRFQGETRCPCSAP